MKNTQNASDCLDTHNIVLFDSFGLSYLTVSLTKAPYLLKRKKRKGYSKCLSCQNKLYKQPAITLNNLNIFKMR